MPRVTEFCLVLITCGVIRPLAVIYSVRIYCPASGLFHHLRARSSPALCVLLRSDSMLHKSINLRQVAIRFILAGCIFIIMPRQALTLPTSQQNVSPCYHKELENLDFLMGDWIVEANVRSGEGKWEQSPATSQIKPDLSGCLLNERFNGSRGGHSFSALGIMGFNSVSGKLQRVWSDSEHGILILYEGNRNGKEMILETEVLLDGKRVRLRNAYLEITRDSFRLESGRSHDDGKTWITVSKLQYKRK